MLFVAAIGAAQKFQPAAIVFKGVEDFSNQDLMDAAGLKLGMALSADDINAHAKQLMSSAMFESLGFRTDDNKLIIELVPSKTVYPLKIGNLPLVGDAALDARLHTVCPLYHGKVPGEGGLLDDVKRALGSILAEQKITATLTATPEADLKTNTVSAIRIDLSSPPVIVGEIKEDVGSNTLDLAAQKILAQQTGSPFDAEGTAARVEVDLKNHYFGLGYLEAEIHASPHLPAMVTATAIRMPMTLSISTGPIYRLAAIQLAPDVLVTQADFDHQSQIHPGDIADAPHVRGNWEYLVRQYHNRGFMQAKLVTTPSFDRDKGTVTYAVTMDSGPQYSMGKLSIDNVTDELAAAIQSHWKMAAGTVFDEHAIMEFFATGDKDPALAHTFASANCKYTLNLNDDHTVDVVLRLEQKAHL
jgi:outer membrane protein assembly factor BamA